MKRVLAAAAIVVVLGGVALWLWSGSAPPAPADAPLPPNPGSVAVAAPSEPPPPRSGVGRLAGRVLGPDGAPLGGVNVDVEFAHPAVDLTGCEGILDGCGCGENLGPTLDRLAQAFAILAETTTNDDGRFELTGLPEVPLSVRATDLHLFATQLAQPGKSPALELTLKTPLAPGVAAIDQESNPLAHVGVLAIVDHRVVDFDRTDEQGTIFVIAPPTARVKVFAVGFVVTGEPAQTEFETLDGGNVTTALAFELEPATLVRGRLLDAEGQPISGAKLRAREGSDDDSEGACADAVSGSDGTYVLGPLGSGRYKVSASAGSRIASFDVVPGLAGGKPDASTETKLLESARVRGQLLDDRGQPLPGVKLELVRFPAEGGNGDTSEFSADEQGRFDQQTLPGKLELVARAPGFVAREDQKLVGEKQTWDVAWTLERAAAISGRVEDAVGRPVNRAWVLAEPLGGDPFSRDLQATTGPDGLFSIETPPGELELRVSADEVLPTTVKARSPQQGLVIVLGAGARVEGRVVDERRAPAAEVEISLSGLNGQSASSATTDAEGKFTSRPVPDGHFELTAKVYAAREDPMVMRQVVRSGKGSVEVRGGKAPFVELVLDPVKAIRGRVVDEQGAPVAGASVFTSIGFISRGTGGSLSMRMMLQSVSSSQRAAMVARLPKVVSAADGTFEMLGQTTPQNLSATAPGLQDDPTAPVIAEPGGEPVVLKMIRPHYLTAELSTSDGKPLTKATLGGVPVAAPGGHFSWEIRVAGAGKIALGAPGYLPVSREVSLDPKADTALGPLTLEAGRPVTIRATDASTGAVVQAWFRVGDTYVTTDRNQGSAVVATLPLGDVVLRVGAADHLEAEVLVGAAQTELAVKVDPGATLTGTVLEPDGRPSTRTGVMVQVTGCPANAWGQVQNDGSYVVKGLGPGTCTATATIAGAPGNGPPKAVTLAAHGTARVDVTLPPPK